MSSELKLEELKNQNNLTWEEEGELLRLRIEAFNAERPPKIMSLKELLEPISFKDRDR